MNQGPEHRRVHHCIKRNASGLWTMDDRGSLWIDVAAPVYSQLVVIPTQNQLIVVDVWEGLGCQSMKLVAMYGRRS